MKIILCAALIAVTCAGCATKHYGREGTVTPFETQTMTCREIDLDIAHTQGFMSEVKDESRFGGKDVLAFLGDFGIGNHMEKSAALDSANKRLGQLKELRAAKQCSGEEKTTAKAP